MRRPAEWTPPPYGPAALSPIPTTNAGGDEDRVGPAAGDHAEDDAEDVDQSVLATQDHVAQPVRLAMWLPMGRGAQGGALRRGPDGAGQAGRVNGLTVGVGAHRARG